MLEGAGRRPFSTLDRRPSPHFHARDIGFIKRALGHCLENTGNGDLVYMKVFRAERFEEVSLLDWLAHIPSTWWPGPELRSVGHH